MNKTFEKIRSKLIMGKIYLNRATGYMGLVNSLLIILVFLKVDGNETLQKYMYFIVIGWVILLLFIGWLEINVGKVLQIEAEKIFYLQKPFADMKQDVMDTKKMVANLEQKIINQEQTIKMEDKNE